MIFYIHTSHIQLKSLFYSLHSQVPFNPNGVVIQERRQRAPGLIAVCLLPNIYNQESSIFSACIHLVNAMESTGAPYTLTAAQFAGQVNLPNRDTAQRQAQVERVLLSFEQAKKQMSEEGIREVYEYLKPGKWIQSARSATDHTAYRRFLGKAGLRSTLYYPQFFVIQAIYVDFGGHNPEAIYWLYRDLSEYWGMTITTDRPFYPRLEDSEKERRLIRACYYGQNDQAGNQVIDTIQGNIAAHNSINNNNDNTDPDSDKQKALDGHIRAVSKLSAELKNEAEEKQRRETDLRGQLETLNQQNLDLQRQIQDESDLRQKAEKELNENKVQLQDTQHQLQDTQRQLQNTQGQLQVTQDQLRISRKDASTMENKMRDIQNCINQHNQHNQLSMEIRELDKQRKDISAKRQQCINSMAEHSRPRVEGFNSANKRPVAGIADGEESKRPRQE
ncbi:uncharacterized protein FMAN_08120 [Fusarium mangiferae]|uniref:Uncharacterized protein n=1 Tax=Fusarium mangiferae TaxID=192010 RepID=A0A1L7U2Y1_FUSMA|nr:uncharacterized protein FMAN_08120 [Fusarium mangiferae]CVL01997.1 uncharacterized protein FMAN_08120 [Fusarium mangiferae]